LRENPEMDRNILNFARSEERKGTAGAPQKSMVCFALFKMHKGGTIRSKLIKLPQESLPLGLYSYQASEIRGVLCN
jgi:hypothetical protein